MFWETKLEELKKLAEVKIELDESTAEWTAKFDTRKTKGHTKAAAIVNLWADVVVGREPIHLHDDKGNIRRTVIWNARWEDQEPPAPASDKPVVEEAEANAFDPAD